MGQGLRERGQIEISGKKKRNDKRIRLEESVTQRYRHTRGTQREQHTDTHLHGDTWCPWQINTKIEDTSGQI